MYPYYSIIFNISECFISIFKLPEDLVWNWVLGQLPTGDNSPPIKNKAQPLPTRGYYLETDPDPIAIVISVELVIHKPTETNAN